MTIYERVLFAIAQINKEPRKKFSSHKRSFSGYYRLVSGHELNKK